MDFSVFKSAVQKRFLEMVNTGQLFRADVSKEMLWETYIQSFPAGTNPIYKERTEHDCTCCKHFVRSIGNVVALDSNNNVMSIWDINIGDFYQVVSDEMSKLVKSVEVNGFFLSSERSIGVNRSGDILTKTVWDHFHLQIPPSWVLNSLDIATELGNRRTTYEVMLRGLTELSLDSIDTVLELIAQNSIYRGEENKFALAEFRKLKAKFDATPEDKRKFTVLKTCLTVPQSVSRIRNTSIGTLLEDITTGFDLEDCIKSFEAKVAPANYKRPTAIVTKAMIEKAKQTLNELGLISALDRRYATLEDITVNNTLFVDKATKPLLSDVFDEMTSEVPVEAKSLNKIEEVSIENFITKVLPTAHSVELLLENRHANNLVSLVAPVDLTANRLFKWDNNFSWSYSGDVADSIKERVKNAGGNITGDIRCSLSWFNYDDLDLHMLEPDGFEISFENKGYVSGCGGMLDVDMNAGGKNSRSAVENICYASKKKMKTGTYKLFVHNYNQREKIDIGFDVEIEVDGVIHKFSYTKVVKDSDRINVADIHYDKDTQKVTVTGLIPSVASSRTIWGLKTQVFHKTNIIMLSPNYWDDKTVGNKHYFFMLDGCQNEGTARGFYNEFLNSELDKHRKVLEIVGTKMRTDETNHQLSGLGFSTTQHNELTVKVTGKTTRTLKVKF